MGLEREYEEARAWVAFNLTLDQVKLALSSRANTNIFPPFHLSFSMH